LPIKGSHYESMSESALLIDALGIAGGVILSICCVPQIYVIYKTKSAGDVSTTFTVLYFLGLLLSTIYMCLIHAWAGAGPLIFETVLAALLCFLVWFYKKKSSDDCSHHEYKNPRVSSSGSMKMEI
jgi:uncharacterized protein with PQ loop repeat